MSQPFNFITIINKYKSSPDNANALTGGSGWVGQLLPWPEPKWQPSWSANCPGTVPLPFEEHSLRHANDPSPPTVQVCSPLLFYPAYRLALFLLVTTSLHLPSFSSSPFSWSSPLRYILARLGHGLVVKNTSFLSRGPEFNSQPHNDSRTSIPVLADSMPTLGLCQHQAHMWYKDIHASKTLTHIKTLK